jgi:hypothetical protein
MKKITLFLVMAISVMTISCSNDDDSSEPAGPTLTPALLAGTYNLNFYESEEVIQEEVTGGTATTTISEVGDTFGTSNIVFDANGTYTVNFQYRVTRTTQLESNDPVEETEIITNSDTGNYSVNDTNQTLTIDGETGDVTLFNDSQLRLLFESTDVETDGTSTFTSVELFL